MIEIDAGALKEAEELLKGLPGAAEKAAKTAIRKTVRGAKQDATRKVKERYTIKPAYITRTMRFDFQAGGLAAAFRSKGRVNDLAYFKHRPQSIPKHRPPKGKYLFSQVIKGGGGPIAHAFLAKMKSGHIGVFYRTGEYGRNNHINKSGKLDQEMIEKLSGPSTPQMLESQTVAAFIQKRMEERLQKNIDHEVNAFLMGYRK